MVVTESSRLVKLCSKGISAFHERVDHQPENPRELEHYPVLLPTRVICTIDPSPQRLTHGNSPGYVFIRIRSLHVLTIRSPSLLAGVVPLLNAAERISNQRRTSILPFAHRRAYHLLLPRLFLLRSRDLPKLAMLFA